MSIKHPEKKHIPVLRALWKEAFGDEDAFLDLFFETGFSPERCLTLWRQERLAAALYWFDCTSRGQKAAYVYAVATDKSFRGQGLCHQLMEALHTSLARQGYAMAILVPGSGSLFRLYESMGYETFGGLREISAQAARQSVSVRKLTTEEYALRRKAFLPEGGVIQEGPLLQVLADGSAFYEGEDFLLCARVEDGKLFAPELLGNTAAAGGILAALECREGRFRAPGQNPFAMVKCLVPCEKPAYFSFALD